MQKVGNRRLVFEGKALRTSGGLRRKDLALSSSGKIVSRKKQRLAKSTKNNLSKHLVKKSVKIKK